MKNILISTFALSGARYLTAILQSYFPAYRRANVIQSTLDAIPEGFVGIAKTHDLQPPPSLNGIGFYVWRDPRDVLASFYLDSGQRDTNNLVRYVLPLWINHVSTWLDSKLPICVLNYEDLRAGFDASGRVEDRGVLDLLSYAMEEPYDLMAKPNSEMKVGRRDIELFETMFTNEQLCTIYDETAAVRVRLKENHVRFV